MRRPHRIELVFTDPSLGNLEIVQAGSFDRSEIHRAWIGLSQNLGSPWTARLLDQHAAVLETRAVDHVCVEAILGTELPRHLKAARARAALESLEL